MEEGNLQAPGEFDEKTKERAEYCLNKCTMCKKAREKGKGFAFSMVKLIEGSLCPWCKAYKKVYGVPAHQMPPES